MDRTLKLLSTYTCEITYEALPAEVVHQVKRTLIDTLGCAMGAFHAELSRIARHLAENVSSRMPARLLGTRHASAPDMAGFANGVMVVIRLAPPGSCSSVPWCCSSPRSRAVRQLPGRRLLRRPALAGRTRRVPGGRRGPRLRAAVDRLRRRAAAFSFLVRRAALSPAAPAGAAAAELDRGAGRPGDRVQHRGLVRDQHELAVVRPGDGDGPPGADGRADRAELRLRRGRHGGRGGAGARVRPSVDRPDRQLLGRPDPRHHPRPAADLLRRRDPARRARRDDEPARRRRRHRRRRAASHDRAGADRLAGGDQGAGHQRRRDLQRQLGAPVREPERR